MNFDDQFQNIENVRVLNAYSDNDWIEDCFQSYAKNLLVIINDYFKTAKKDIGIVDNEQYGICLKRWTQKTSGDNEKIIINSGKMVSVIITHLASKRTLKIDLSSYTDIIKFTAFGKLTLDDQNIVVARESSALMAGEGVFYNYQSLGILGKMYEFIEFGLVDYETVDLYVSLH